MVATGSALAHMTVACPATSLRSRNRMVHFYQNVTEEELYTICTSEIADVLAVRDAFVSWLRNNPECIDNFMP